MIPEHQIIPYETSGLFPGPWLVLAPHPDDESFGMGGSLACAAATGIDTRVLILTDGALGGQQTNLIEIREAEAKAAADVLDIGQVDFLGEQDRALRPTEELVIQLGIYIRSSNAATVFFPGVLEPHPDHRAAAELAWRALAWLNDAEIQAAAYEISVQSPINRLIDISAWMDAKRQALACYASQLGENNYADIVAALNKARTFTLPPEVEYAEGFYLYSKEERASNQTLRDLTLHRLATLFL